MLWRDNVPFASSEATAAAVFILGFVMCAGYLLLENFKVKGEFSDSHVCLTTPWSGCKEIRFEDLVSARFNVAAYWYLLEHKDGSRMRISGFLEGHGELVEKLEQFGYQLN